MWLCSAVWLLAVAVGPAQPAHGSNSSIKLLRAEKRPWANEGQVESIRGVYLEDLAAKIGANLRQISNQEMGVTAMQVRTANSFDFGQFSPLFSHINIDF